MTSDISQTVCRYTVEQHAAQAIVLFAAGAAIGASFAWFIAKRRCEEAFDIALQEELEAARNVRTIIRKEGYSTPEEAVEKLIPQQTKQETTFEGEGVFVNDEYVAVDTSEAAEEEVVETVFGVAAEDIEEQMLSSDDDDDFEPLEVDPDWDYAKEMVKRDTSKPYVIHEDEWLENEFEHEQTEITYYAGDNILADEKDDPILDVDVIIGKRNLKRFGHGTGDPNVVLIRNEQMRTDFQVDLSNGTFAEEVHGGFNLEHSERSYQPSRERRTRPPKFGRDDL